MYTGTSKDTSPRDLKNTSNDVYEVKNDLYDAANQAGNKVRKLFNSASDEITHAADTVTTQVRRKPVQSSVIALGVGFILGSLFRR